MIAYFFKVCLHALCVKLEPSTSSKNPNESDGGGLQYQKRTKNGQHIKVILIPRGMTSMTWHEHLASSTLSKGHIKSQL